MHEKGESDYLVEPRRDKAEGNWVIVRYGELYRDNYRTQKQAIKAAKRFVKDDKSSRLMIKTSDGKRVREEYTYG